MDGKYKTEKFVKTTMHCLFTQNTGGKGAWSLHSLLILVTVSANVTWMSELCDVCTCGGDAVSPHLEKQGRGDEARAHLRCSFALYPSNVEHKADSSSVTSLPTCSQKLIQPHQIIGQVFLIHFMGRTQNATLINFIE